jgi:hypothetical protein
VNTILAWILALMVIAYTVALTALLRPLLLQRWGWWKTLTLLFPVQTVPAVFTGYALAHFGTFWPWPR